MSIDRIRHQMCSHTVLLCVGDGSSFATAAISFHTLK